MRALYAVESGSRAWGFPSPDSDYDVRFLYVHPRDDYLTVSLPRDVIELELPGDIDLAGWDLRKALLLMRNSNPSLSEWLSSGIVYRENAPFMTDLRPLAQACFSPERLFKHYLHMAEGNWRAYLCRERVLFKKYLYALRPVLACRWIEQSTEAVPMAFADLCARVLPDDLSEAVRQLLERKAITSELGEGEPVAEIHEFIGAELKRLANVHIDERSPVDVSDLDRLFRKWSAWASPT